MTGDALPKVVEARVTTGFLAAEGGRQGVVAAVLALGAALFMSYRSRDFCLDDAWIHLAYAKSLRLGDGFSYNPGDHETGFSSPLWAFLIAVTPFASEPIVAVKLLGGLCHAALAWGAARVALLLAAAGRGGGARAGWIAGVLVACDPLLVFAAGSGMEVSLTAALSIWTLFVVARAAPDVDRPNLAGVLGAVALGMACVWARPESLFLLAPYCALRWYATRSQIALAPLLGAFLALAIWMLYCQLVSGYPWPNTYYAKRHADPLRGLLYFAVRVLPAQAWAVGLTGVVFTLAAFVRSGPARALAVAWLLAVIAIAGSRVVLMGALFYCTRYFAILGAIPCVLAASQLPAQRRFALLAAAPIVIASALLLPQARALQRAQEQDITAVHVEPAQYLARELPAGARVAVEGAGATRFFLPRSVRVIDVVGLNYARAVHARTSSERLCSVLRQRPSHVLLPDGIIQFFERALVLEPMRTFVDEHTAITVRSAVHRVHAARVRDVQPEARRICQL
jgi:hypothetical protein